MLSRMQSQKIHPETIHQLFSHHQKHIKLSRAPNRNKKRHIIYKSMKKS